MTGENITRGDELSVAAVEKVCNQIRNVQGKERRLLFLNAKYMTELNASQAKKVEECDWSEEIARRLGKVFDNKVFFDIVLPLKIQKQWTLVIWDFVGREVRVVGFRRDASKLPIVLLNEFFTNVWKAAAMEGVKTYSGQWHKEKTAKWKVTQATAGKNAEESESLGLKRMLVLLYEMAASSFPAMMVANVITPSLNSDEEVGKALAIFQAALAVRKVGVYAVRVVDEVDVKQKLQSRRTESRQSNQWGGGMFSSSSVRTPVGGAGPLTQSIVTQSVQ